ncbi:MAG: carbon-nitrogen hydrolase family protein [Ginsengibacter sp.]
MKKPDRRSFIKNTMLGAGALGIPSSISASPIKGKDEVRGESDRMVWIASLTQDGITGSTVKEVIQAALKQMEYAVPFSPDIYCLPEVFHVAGLTETPPPLKESAEDGSGNIIAPFQQFAKTHSCYIVCDVYTQHQGKYYNAALLIDRKGKVIGEYQKARITENEIRKGLTPGPLTAQVFKTDFGTIGIQICHDIQWSDGWDELRDKGAEIVFWPSAFSGGKRINMRAWTNQYCVVSSTWKNTTKICDITGEEIAVTGNWNTWGVCAPVNLEKAFLHSWPYSRKFPEIEKKYGRKVKCYSLNEEEISIIEVLVPGLKVKDILKEFNLITYREFIKTGEEQQAKLRDA